jgi:UDPglucose 6-dehydrogenase
MARKEHHVVGTGISIIGSGVVGQATGIGLYMHGHDVVFFDIDKRKLEDLRERGYTTAETLYEAVERSNISMISVPTPTVDKRIDLAYVKAAVREVAKALKRKKTYHLVVIRSTVLPYTTRQAVIPILEKQSGLKTGKDFGLCVNPEFLREAYALADFLNPPVIVIGEYDKRSGDVLEAVYSGFQAEVIRTTLENAEVIKYATNIFNATKISFFNEMYMICQTLNLDHNLITKVLPKSALGLRLPEWGSKGGWAFGGKCLPKDLDAMISFSKGHNINPKLFEAVAAVNEDIASFSKEHPREEASSK